MPISCLRYAKFTHFVYHFSPLEIVEDCAVAAKDVRACKRVASVIFAQNKLARYTFPCIRPFQFFVCAISLLLLPICADVVFALCNSSLMYHVFFLNQSFVEALSYNETVKHTRAAKQGAGDGFPFIMLAFADLCKCFCYSV